MNQELRKSHKTDGAIFGRQFTFLRKLGVIDRKRAQSLKLSEVHDSAVRLLFKFREHEFFCESGPFSYTLDFYSFFVKSNQTAGSCTSVNFETL